MTVERCELTELWPSDCGCRNHRGGQTPQEEAEQEIRRAGQVIGRRPDTRGWFPAMYAGKCAACSRDIEPGQMIHRFEESWACCD